jgi:hypothetical protein
MTRDLDWKAFAAFLILAAAIFGGATLVGMAVFR